MAADAAPCALRKGIYESWLGMSKRASQRPAVTQDSLVAPGTANRGVSDASNSTDIGREYNAFFQCLSDLADNQQGGEALESSCQAAGADPIAWPVCRMAVYLKRGRTESKDFLDALLLGKKGAQLVWDLEGIAGSTPAPSSKMFPKGAGYKLLDELFLLVLDDKDTAAAKYFNMWSAASPAVEKYMSSQVQVLLRESPAVVVKQWPVVRNYRTQLKKVLTAMPAPEVKKSRQGFDGFCTPDNLDCQELLKLFGKS